MFKKSILFILLCISTTVYANEEFTTWKCIRYPKTNSPYTNNYAIIQFNDQKAIRYSYIQPPLSSHFSLLKLNYKYLAKDKNDPFITIYLYPENNAMLVIDKKRRIASTALISLPRTNDINARYINQFGKKVKLSLNDKTGVSGDGYYCNINQNTKFPESVGIISDHYD